MNADPQPCPEAWCANNDHHISNKLNYFYTFLIDQAIVLTARLRTQIWVRVWIQNIVVFLLFIFNQSFIDVYPQNNLTSGWSPVPCPGGRGHVQSAPGTHCHPARYLLGRGTGSLCCSGKGGGGHPTTSSATGMLDDFLGFTFFQSLQQCINLFVNLFRYRYLLIYTLTVFNALPVIDWFFDCCLMP